MGIIEAGIPVREICRNDNDCNISESASVVAGAVTIGETASRRVGTVATILKYLSMSISMVNDAFFDRRQT